MNTETLEKLDDDELRAIGERVEELLKLRDEERKAKALADAKALKAKALADARAVLATAGLSLKDMGAKKPRPAKAPVYQAGREYRHPVNASLTWNGKGQKPGWLRELEKGGARAVEAANDSPAKKAG